MKKRKKEKKGFNHYQSISRQLKIISLLFLSLSFTNCSSKKFDSSKIKKQINVIMDNWHNNAKKADLENYMQCISEDGMYLGTDHSENWNKKDFKAFSKPFFDKKNTWNFKAIERNIYLSDDKNIAWFDEVLETWMGVCRGSGVLEKQDNSWMIKHYVLSVSIPNEDLRKVIKIKKNKDSIYLKNHKNHKMLKT